MIYRFEEFELDEERVELRRGLERLAIPRKSFEILRQLLRSAGRVVSKAELFAAVWPGEHVSDPVLPVHMRTIRKTLGESENGAIIRTVRGRGYCLVCPVENAQVKRSTSQPVLPAAAAFVGRAALIEELQTEFWSAAAGQGRALLLYGEAGIGKTRVLEEFAQWARRQDAMVLHARGESDPGAPPFWMLQDLLRSGSRAFEHAALRKRLDEQGFDADRWQTRMRELLAEDGEQGLDPDSARFRLSRTVVGLAARIARIVPLVLVVDDAHCVDEGSLRVWKVAVRQLREERVLMIAAYREGELQREGRLSRTLGALASESLIREIAVPGLDSDAIEELVRAEAGCRPPIPFVRSLYEYTEGNPFFLRELLRLLAAEGKLGPGTEWNLPQVGLPRASREAIERRLSAVSPECNELLVWAAVIGRRCSFPLLQRAAGLSGASVLERLREAAEARILTTEPPASGASPLPVGEYRFAHGLFREAIYTRLSGPERVLRHRTVAEALEGLLCRAVSKDLPELAHHFFEAAPGGDIDRAADYSVRAARAALRVFDCDDAVWHFEHALRAEELRSPPDALRVCCVALALADALRRASRYDEAQAMFLHAAQGIRDLGRADLLAYCALGLAKWPRFVGPKAPFFLAGRGPSQEQRKEVLLLVDEALRAVDGDPADPSQASLRARLRSVQARAEEARGYRGSAASLAEQAVALARRSDDKRALFDALLARRMSLRMPQDAARGLEVASELVQIAEAIGAKPLQFLAYEARIQPLLGLGEIEALDRDLAAAGEIAARVRAPEYQYTVSRVQVCRALADGRLEEARAQLVHYGKFGAGAGDCEVSWKRGLIGLGLAWLEGRSARVRTQMEALVEQGQVRSAGEHAFMADYWRGIGELRRCAEHFEQAAAEGFADLELNDDWLWVLALCAQCCAHLSDARRAAQLYERIAPYAAFNVTGSLGTYRGSAHYDLARLSVAMGDGRLARKHFEAALAFNRRIGARVTLLFAQAHYSQLLARGSVDERSRSRGMREAVVKEAEALGIRPVLHALE